MTNVINNALRQASSISFRAVPVGVVSHVVIFDLLQAATFTANFASGLTFITLRRGHPFCQGLGLFLLLSSMSPLGALITTRLVYGTQSLLWLWWQWEWSLLLLTEQTYTFVCFLLPQCTDQGLLMHVTKCRAWCIECH